MSNTIKLLVTFGFVGIIAACAPQEEEVVVIEPISAEPAYTGKYK